MGQVPADAGIHKCINAHLLNKSGDSVRLQCQRMREMASIMFGVAGVWVNDNRHVAGKDMCMGTANGYQRAPFG